MTTSRQPGDAPHHPRFAARDLLKYIGPGLLVTVGFIDPGNWASNVAAGAEYGYALLWMVTLSTIMLVLLQHNVAHLGIATGLCLSEAARKHLRPRIAIPALLSAVAAGVATAVAEILGAAIGLRMLTGLDLRIGAVLATALVLWMILSNSYRRLERWIIGFVSLIGIAFLVELSFVKVDWPAAASGWVTPAFPLGSIAIIMAVLGAVVMPHNLFLHSEVIQSRQWNLEDEEVIEGQLRYEFLDTLLSMSVGWAINSAMIILAAATFWVNKVHVAELEQAQQMLVPLVGNGAALIFAVALLLAGVASSVTAGMAGASIYAGIFNEPYDPKDAHSRQGVLITLVGALLVIFLIADPFKGLIISQVILSIQLPWTIFTQLRLTSDPAVMGRHANSPRERFALWTVAVIVAALNVLLLGDIIRNAFFAS